MTNIDQQRLKSVIKSTSIVLTTSLLGALSTILLGFPFWASFLFFVAFQFILFSFIGGMFTYYIGESRRKKEAELKIKELDELEKLSTILECAYCHKKNLMIFNPDDTERIEFECDHCNKKNLVTIQFMVSQISQPLDIPKVVGIPSESVENY